MKANFTFDTSIPEEAYELEIFANASNFYRALQDFSEDILRKGRKYDQFRGKELTEEEHNFICEIEEDFYKILNEYGVHLDL